jgi:ATP-binding cassette subfamily B protein
MTRQLPTRNWHYLRPFLPPRSRLRMVGLGVVAFLGSLAESLVLVIVTLTADSLIRGAQDITVLNVDVSRTTAVLVALVLVAARVTMALIGSATAARFSGQVMENAQHALLDAYLDAAHPVRSSRPPGDLSAVALTHGMFTGNLALSFTTLAAGACGLLAFGGTSLVVNPVATVAIALIGGLLLLALRPIRRRSRAASISFTEMQRSLGQEVTQIEALHREIEVFRVSGTVLERASADLSEGARRYSRVRFVGAMVPQVFQAAVLAAAVLSLLLVVNSTGDTDLAGIGAVVLLLIRSMSYAQQVVLANQQILEQGAYTKGLTELEATLREDTREFGTARPDSLVPLRLDHVSFSYDGEHPVLHDVDLKFDAGELVGIVGPSGAGKSTLVELLLRLRAPTNGTISCGSAEIDEVDPYEFAQRVAFVPQQAVLITGTVADNVSFFRDISEDRVREALRQAHLEAEIDALPDGIHTMLGPDERALSGGQRQRLTIARALAGDPEILVLDEPTSALDAVSEIAIRETLEELPTGRVVLVVAHRYSTLRSCGRILVLRDGVVEIDASPDEVAAASSFFQSMVNEGA